MNRPFPALTASFRTVLVGLVVVDLCFILIHGVGFLLHLAGVTGEIAPMFRITEGGALPEDFNYLKWAVIVAALLWIAARDRWLTPLCWAVVFAMILLDDSLQFHETFGFSFAARTGLSSDGLLSGSDMGELVAFAMMGVVALALAAVTVRRLDPDSRRLSLRYGLIVVALAVFGAGVDSLHQIVSHLTEGHPLANVLAHVFAMIEDGGEMLVASVAAAITLVPPEPAAAKALA